VTGGKAWLLFGSADVGFASAVVTLWYLQQAHGSLVVEWLSIYLSTYQPIYLSIYQSINLYIYIFIAAFLCFDLVPDVQV
jgi:hypothetical protein